jgi:hypothetical protein
LNAVLETSSTSFDFLFLKFAIISKILSFIISGMALYEAKYDFTLL